MTLRPKSKNKEEIKKMRDVEGRNYFTPEYTRKMLIVALFEEGFSIELIFTLDDASDNFG